MAKKEEAPAPEMESIYIPQPDKQDKTLTVFVNGKRHNLKRGKKNSVPPEVAEVLRNSDYLEAEE